MAEDYEETVLYGGDTRPAVLRWVGLPLTVAVPLVIAVPIIFNWISAWRGRCVAFAIWAIAGACCWVLLRYDHNAPRILDRWFNTKFLSFDARKWLGATPDPFPYRASKDPHGIYND